MEEKICIEDGITISIPMNWICVLSKTMSWRRAPRHASEGKRDGDTETLFLHIINFSLDYNVLQFEIHFKTLDTQLESSFSNIFSVSFKHE